MKYLNLIAAVLCLVAVQVPLFADEEFFELCKSGSAEEIKTALDSGASATARSSEGLTPLMIAAKENKDPGVITMLIKAGASVKERGEYGDTPLMFAAEYNHSAAVAEELIKNGASVKDKNRFSQTPLLSAAEKNESADVLSVLLKAGASMKDKNYDGSSALILAARNNPSAEVIKLLLKSGASVKERIDVISENYTVAPNGVVIECGTRELKCKPGWTPLLLAAFKNKSPEVIQVLAGAGASVNEFIDVTIVRHPEHGGSLREMFGDRGKKDNSWNEHLSPLMLAAANTSNPDVVSALLKAGADAKAKNRAGETAADMAKQNYDVYNTPAYWALKDALYK